MGRGGRRQSRVSGFRPVLLTLQQRFKRTTPSVRKRFDPQRALQTIAWVRRQIEQRVNLSDSHALCRLSHFHNFVAGTHLTFPQNAEIEARPATGCEQRRHPRFVHPNADAIARYAGLRDLEKCGADLKSIADAHGIISQFLDRKVLTELPVNEIAPLQLLLPIPIRFDLIDEDGSMLTSMPGQVALTVSLEIQPSRTTATGHRTLPDPGVHTALFPHNVARKPNVPQEQRSHTVSIPPARILLSPTGLSITSIVCWRASN